ncbi:MAG: trigger factor [Clostridia bacterium]|nr:trigger factor [Clostridia bacterium]
MKHTKKIEKNVVTFELKFSKEEYDSYEDKAYEKDKNEFKVEGFRKGKVPKKVIENTYGKQVFFETAVNLMLDDHYYQVLSQEKDLKIIDKPDIDVSSFNEKGLTIVVKLPLIPEVVLGAYEGLTVEKAKIEITEADVFSELKQYQEQAARMVDVTDRAVKNGDITVIDFEGKVDGVAFKGGTAKAYELEIGSHSFIDNFENQIIGMNIGDTRDIFVTFPENYQEKTLAGKPAVFTIVLHGIKEKELPELNDEFASNSSTFETLEEFKKDIEKNLREEKEKNAENDFEDKIIEMITDNSEFDVPEALVDDQLEDEMKRIDQNLRYQGIDLVTYCKFIGKTVEDFKAERRPFAKKNVKSQFVIQEIIKKENLTATQEEIDAKIDEYAKNSNMTREDFEKRSPNVLERVENAIIVEKLFKMLKEKNNVKEI